jgi:hypothetical protein
LLADLHVALNSEELARAVGVIEAANSALEQTAAVMVDVGTFVAKAGHLSERVSAVSGGVQAAVKIGTS